MNQVLKISPLGVILLYTLYAYWISISPSNLEQPYPQWFSITSYAVLLPSALLGHHVAVKTKNA